MHFVLLYCWSTNKCTGQWHCGSTTKDELPDPRGSLANDIPSHAIEKPIKKFDMMITIHNTRQTHSDFSVFKFHVLFDLVY